MRKIIFKFIWLHVPLQKFRVFIMLKQITALILLLAFGFQTFSKAFIVVDYYTNTSLFAKNCENKDRPQLQCKGKCQMLKKLKQEEKKEEQNPDRKGEHKNEIPLSSKSFFTAFNFIGFIIKSNKKIPHYLTGKGSAPVFPIFHPPCVLTSQAV